MVGLAVLVIGVGVLAFWPRKKTIVIQEERVAIPTQDTTIYGSDTGAAEVTLAESQYDEVYLIKDLRNKCPISKDNFTIDFDYSVNKFMVSYKNQKGINDFQTWLSQTGYNVISQSYFQVKQ